MHLVANVRAKAALAQQRLQASAETYEVILKVQKLEKLFLKDLEEITRQHRAVFLHVPHSQGHGMLDLPAEATE